MWLAEQGWRVAGVDVSAVALARAARRARAAGVGDRVTWERHDLDVSFPAGSYDLVSAHYLHSPRAARRAQALQEATRAVSPGGTLVVVGHASVAPWSWQTDVELPTARQVLDGLRLDADEWSVAVCEDRSRSATGPGGEAATVTDSVLRLRRSRSGHA